MMVKRTRFIQYNICLVLNVLYEVLKIVSIKTDFK